MGQYSIKNIFRNNLLLKRKFIKVGFNCILKQILKIWFFFKLLHFGLRYLKVYTPKNAKCQCWCTSLFIWFHPTLTYATYMVYIWVYIKIMWNMINSILISFNFDVHLKWNFQLLTIWIWVNFIQMNVKIEWSHTSLHFDVHLDVYHVCGVGWN